MTTTSYSELKPIKKPIKNRLVVLLHGFGSNGNDLISIAQQVRSLMPDYHFFAPDGVESCELSAFGKQWFSLHNREVKILSSLIDQNIILLQEMIIKYQKKVQVMNQDTVILGFSQGTIMGLYLTLIQKNTPFASMVGFSGTLIPPKQCNNTETPVCLIHGQEDQVIEVSCLSESTQYLERYNIEYDQFIIPGLGHSINRQGIDHAVEFIQHHLDNQSNVL